MVEAARGRSGLVSSAVVLSAATMVANVLGYVLTIVAARTLPTAEFGAFSALLALVIVGNVAALAVQAAVARRAAQGRPSLAGTGLLTAAVVALAAAVLAPIAAGPLQLSGPQPLLAVAVSLGALAATAVPLGLAQGHEQFGRLAVMVAVQAALRVGGGIGGLLLTGTVLGGMVGIALGLTLAGLAAWAWLRPPLGASTLGAGREVGAAALVLLGFVLLTNADVVLARGLLTPSASGIYAAGSIITKAGFWLTAFVPLLAFPRLSSPQRRGSALRLALVAVLLMGVAVVGTTAVLSEQIVLAVAGDRYLAVAPDLAWFALLGSVLAVCQVSVYAGLARHDGGTTVAVWTALAALVGSALVVQPDGAALVRLACAVAATLAVLVSLRELRHRDTGLVVAAPLV
jgi:O-antigen/teichoic acid export membrane protein